MVVAAVAETTRRQDRPMVDLHLPTAEGEMLTPQMGTVTDVDEAVVRGQDEVRLLMVANRHAMAAVDGVTVRDEEDEKRRRPLLEFRQTSLQHAPSISIPSLLCYRTIDLPLCLRLARITD